MAKSKTLDFGEKIGGARKDAWRTTGLRSSDIDEMTDYEKQQYVNKNYIWRKPDYEQMKADGIPVEVIYFIKLVRDALPAKFVGNRYLDITRDEQYRGYIDFIQRIKGVVEEVRTLEDINSLSSYLENEGIIESFGRRYNVRPEYDHLVGNKLVNVMLFYGPNIRRYRREIARKEFLMDDFGKAMKEYMVLRLEPDTRINGYSYSEAMTRDYGNDDSLIGVLGKLYEPEGGESVGGSLVKVSEVKRLLSDVKAGEYFAIGGRSFLFSADNPDELFEKCFEHYKAKHQGEDKAKTSTRKKTYMPPQLAGIKRYGPEWRTGNVTGQDMLDDFSFRGGEFGNWLNENDRVQSLNFAYDAMMDLAYALGLQPKDISFDGELAVAFGSRGKGGKSAGVAHYEPARQVINLTKMKGAGSLGHEWIHAMDHAVASAFGNTTICLATEGMWSLRRQIPEAFGEIMRVIKDCPEYIGSARKLDKEYSKSGLGYWSSDCELLARAGACWLRDRLTAKGIRNDYLVGHSEGISIAPHGEEREKIDKAFDNWLNVAKELGFFNQQYLLHGKVNEVEVTLETSRDDWVTGASIEAKQLTIFDVPGIDNLFIEQMPDEDLVLPGLMR